MKDLFCTLNSCGAELTCSSFSIVSFFISLFLAILFLQSGLDKVNDYKGNLSWLKEHFSKTFMRNMVPLLLVSLTVLELGAGTFSLAGLLIYALKGCNSWMFLGNLFGVISLSALFFGQRVAKDYAGAQSLVGYFILTLMGLYLSC